MIKKLSIIIPLYNEEKRIPQSIIYLDKFLKE